MSKVTYRGAKRLRLPNFRPHPHWAASAHPGPPHTGHTSCLSSAEGGSLLCQPGVEVSRQHQAGGLRPEEALGGDSSSSRGTFADSDLSLALHRGSRGEDSRPGVSAGPAGRDWPPPECWRLCIQPDGPESPLLPGTTSPVGGRQGAAGCPRLSTCATGWVLGEVSWTGWFPSPTFPVPGESNP